MDIGNWCICDHDAIGYLLLPELCCRTIRFVVDFVTVIAQDFAHLNRDKIKSNLSVPGIQGHQENALIKSFKMSPHLIYLWVSSKTLQGQPVDQVWIQAGPKGMLMLVYRHIKQGLISSSYARVLVAPFPRYTQVGFNLVSVQVCPSLLFTFWLS